MSLTVESFFRYYLFHPTEAKTPKERNISLISSIALGIFTLGIVHFICALALYNKEIVVKREPAPQDRTVSTLFRDRASAPRPSPSTSSPLAALHRSTSIHPTPMKRPYRRPKPPRPQPNTPPEIRISPPEETPSKDHIEKELKEEKVTIVKKTKDVVDGKCIEKTERRKTFSRVKSENNLPRPTKRSFFKRAFTRKDLGCEKSKKSEPEDGIILSKPASRARSTSAPQSKGKGKKPALIRRMSKILPNVEGKKKKKSPYEKLLTNTKL